MEIREITTPDEKRRITRFILESLPDWFGIPEAREEYIERVLSSRFSPRSTARTPSASFTLPKRGGIQRNSMSWAC